MMTVEWRIQTIMETWCKLGDGINWGLVTAWHQSALFIWTEQSIFDYKYWL